MFLKASRLVKRRTGAREMCESGKVIVNGREAKPAKEVRQGDVIELRYPSRIVEIEVLETTPGPSRKKVPPEDLFRMKSSARLTNKISEA